MAFFSKKPTGSGLPATVWGLRRAAGRQKPGGCLSTLSGPGWGTIRGTLQVSRSRCSKNAVSGPRWGTARGTLQVSKEVLSKRNQRWVLLILRNSCCFQSLDPFLKLRNVQICQGLTFLNLSRPLEFSDSRVWGLQVRLRARDSSKIRPRMAGMRPPRPGKSSFSL